jgi:hypothetical protein
VIFLAKVAVDIDDTLYDFGIKIREEFFKMAIEYDDRELLKGAYAPHLEWRSLSDSLSEEIVSEAIDRVHADESILIQTPYEYCVDTLWNIKDSGHEIIYISSRKEKSHMATWEWLSYWNFPDATLENVLCVQSDKAPYLLYCQYLIDDRPNTVADFVGNYTWRKSHGNSPEKQRKAFGLWFPYNQALTDLKNVYLAPSWFGIEYYLKRKGVITID